MSIANGRDRLEVKGTKRHTGVRRTKLEEHKSVEWRISSTLWRNLKVNSTKKVRKNTERKPEESIVGVEAINSVRF